MLCACCMQAYLVIVNFHAVDPQWVGLIAVPLCVSISRVRSPKVNGHHKQVVVFLPRGRLFVLFSLIPGFLSFTCFIHGWLFDLPTSNYPFCENLENGKNSFCQFKSWDLYVTLNVNISFFQFIDKWWLDFLKTLSLIGMIDNWYSSLVVIVYKYFCSLGGSLIRSLTYQTREVHFKKKLHFFLFAKSDFLYFLLFFSPLFKT